MENLKDGELAKILENESKPVVVDFWAEWCGPCRMLSPVLEELSAEMSDSVRIVKMNVYECAETASQYNIRSIPTLILFKGGENKAVMTGFKSKEDLKSWIEPHL